MTLQFTSVKHLEKKRIVVILLLNHQCFDDSEENT